MSQQIVPVKEPETAINTATPMKTSDKMKSCPKFIWFLWNLCFHPQNGLPYGLLTSKVWMAFQILAQLKDTDLKNVFIFHQHHCKRPDDVLFSFLNKSEMRWVVCFSHSFIMVINWLSKANGTNFRMGVSASQRHRRRFLCFSIISRLRAFSWLITVCSSLIWRSIAATSCCQTPWVRQPLLIGLVILCQWFGYPQKCGLPNPGKVSAISG